MNAFHCRSCGCRDGLPVLDLGLQPLANNLLRPSDLGRLEPRFPLRVAVCRSCWLVQILDIIPPVELFSEYLYFSSFSDEMQRHARAACERHVASERLGPGSWVVEVASNDGYLLRNMVEAGIPCIGIEPAANIARVAEERGVPTLVRFFGRALAEELAGKGRRADLILGNNVFAHAPDPNDFVAGLAALVAPAGRVVLEFPYVGDLLAKAEFDTIYHEHVFYFSLGALMPLFRRHGLDVFEVERLPIHGGSLRLSAAPAGSRPIDPSVPALVAEEKANGLYSEAAYVGFAGRVLRLREELRALLLELHGQGARIAAYGASAKGSTLLNFHGIGRDGLDVVEFVADRSTAKQGLLTPGSHLPVVGPDQLLARGTTHALLLVWNFAEEVLRQQQAYRDAGGRFVLPLPEVRML